MPTVNEEKPGGYLVTVDYPYADYGISMQEAAEIFALVDQHIGEETAVMQRKLERRRGQGKETPRQGHRTIALRYLGSQAAVDVRRQAVRVTSELGGVLMKEATDIAVAAARKVAVAMGSIKFPLNGHPNYLVKPLSE